MSIDKTYIDYETYKKEVAEVERLKQENKQLREALKKCIPFTACSNKANNVCEFCFEKEHADDCEYIKLREAEQ